jgi:uncharacterized membrane protein YfcA
MAMDVLLLACLLVVGFLYASVGHGGASGYIAVFSLFNVAMPSYKPWVLVMNVIIASMAFIQFYRSGHFRWRQCWPFLLTSIPAAYIGSQWAVQTRWYNLFLGLALIFPVIRLIGLRPKEHVTTNHVNIPFALLIGVIIGFASGMLNIGGGIFLSPVLIMLAWTNAKESAAAAALFIVFNSLAGLLGGKLSGYTASTSSYLWLFAALSGGLLGAFLGSRHFQQKTIQYLLASVLAIASVKLIFFS